MLVKFANQYEKNVDTKEEAIKEITTFLSKKVNDLESNFPENCCAGINFNIEVHNYSNDENESSEEQNQSSEEEIIKSLVNRLMKHVEISMMLNSLRR